MVRSQPNLKQVFWTIESADYPAKHDKGRTDFDYFRALIGDDDRVMSDGLLRSEILRSLPPSSLPISLPSEFESVCQLRNLRIIVATRDIRVADKLSQ